MLNVAISWSKNKKEQHKKKNQNITKNVFNWDKKKLMNLTLTMLALTKYSFNWRLLKNIIVNKKIKKNFILIKENKH